MVHCRKWRRTKEVTSKDKLPLILEHAIASCHEDPWVGSFLYCPRRKGSASEPLMGPLIENYGRRNVAFKTEGRKGVNCMTFRVTDVKKPLASVSKIVEKGSSVHFTPEGSYIKGPSGERIDLKLQGGVYVMDVQYVKGFNGQA